MSDVFDHIRRIDDLGRVVIPKAARRAMGLKCGDELRMVMEDGRLVVTVVKE